MQAEMTTQTRRILVVDDNVDSAEMVAAMVSMWGHDVRVANDGEAALLVARDYHPEVVLLDLGLPDIDGFEVARKLKEEKLVGRLLVAVSGYGQPEDRARTRAAGFDEHLTKPIDPQVVRQVIQR
jgi:CheY-like chemotaxis protein